MRTMLRVIIVFGLFAVFGPLSFATTEIVNIGVMWGNKPSAISVSAGAGGYTLIADGTKILEIANGDKIELLQKEGKVVVKQGKKKLGAFAKIRLKRVKWGSTLKVQSTAPYRAPRIYQDNLTVSPWGKVLKLVNNVYIEHYISGVVEAEAGGQQTYEYYRVQSIICRTYALNRLRRHEKQGFNLCDRVHCQVYRGKSRANKQIKKSAFDTKGIVIVDSDINLITASFHSNCGGQTVNSEDVWKYPLPYLKSVCDTFCSGQPHAHWKKKIPKQDWESYLQKKYAYTPINDTLSRDSCIAMLPENREIHLAAVDSTIELKTLRKDLKLRSTFFAIEQVQDTVTFIGNGFGHGVGLCQEGAMRMADLGMPYRKILHYYYRDVHLINLSALDFFREE